MAPTYASLLHCDGLHMSGMPTLPNAHEEYIEYNPVLKSRRCDWVERACTFNVPSRRDKKFVDGHVVNFQPCRPEDMSRRASLFSTIDLAHDVRVVG